MFQIKQISNYGTSNFIVARLSIQTQNILQPFYCINNDVKESIFTLYNLKIQKRLLVCNKINEEITNEIKQINNEIEKNGLKTQSQGRSIHIPQVLELEERIEQFLYSAKSVLRDLTEIFHIFFGKKFTEARYDKVLSWSEDEFGIDNNLTKLINQDHELWIKRIVTLRNAIEHPGGYSGNLKIDNFELIDEKLLLPSWQLNDEDRFLISTDLNTIVLNLLEFSEEVLINCIDNKIGGIPDFFRITEVPLGERDEKCPIRLRVLFQNPN